LVVQKVRKNIQKTEKKRKISAAFSPVATEEGRLWLSEVILLIAAIRTVPVKINFTFGRAAVAFVSDLPEEIF